MSSTFPSPEQKKVIESPGSALIIAGPGTGKTRTAIAKARWSISKLRKPLTEKILFLSFSNASIYRLADSAKINLTIAEKRNTKFQTFHSCAVDILKSYGRFVGLPPKISIADTLEQTLITIENNWEFGTEGSDKNFYNLAKSKGIITFKNIIPFAIKLLNRSPSIRDLINRKFPVIIVDEFQDTSQEQWELLQLIGEKSEVSVFGDPNQIIYEGLHKATAKRFDEFKNWKNINETPFTPQNFRCGSADILDFAESILKGKSFEFHDKDDIACIKLNYRTELRSQLAIIWQAIRKQVGKDETVGFLTPSNKLAEEVSVALRNPPINASVRFPVYAPLVPDDAANDAVQLAYYAFLEHTLNPTNQTIKNTILSILALRLAWKGPKFSKKDSNELARSFLHECNTQGTLLNLLQSKIIITPTNDAISAFVDALATLPKLDKVSEKIKDHGMYYIKRSSSNIQLPLFEETRANRNPKGLYGTPTGKGLTQVLNYHKSKGREFDFVVIIADPRQESTRSTLDEKRRLYYVSATRAKKWLGTIYYGNEISEVLRPVVASP